MVVMLWSTHASWHGVLVYGRGTVWYRLVGVDVSRGNLIADAGNGVTYITEQLNVQQKFGPFVQIVATNTNVSSGAGALAGSR